MRVRESAIRPCRPARASLSSRLTRSTTLKKRPRVPPPMQAPAIAIARRLLPGPLPPLRTALRCSAMNAPEARSRTRVSFTGVSAKAKSSRSLAKGSLARVSWYLIERACFSVEVLGQGQFGEGELVLDRARLLFGDLGLE